jgi:hypothetical protein
LNRIDLRIPNSKGDVKTFCSVFGGHIIACKYFNMKSCLGLLEYDQKQRELKNSLKM